MCVYVCGTCLWVCEYECLYRGQRRMSDILLHRSLPYCLEIKPVTELEDHCVDQAGWLASYYDLAVSVPWCWGYRHMQHVILFRWILGWRGHTQVLILAQKMLLQSYGLISFASTLIFSCFCFFVISPLNQIYLNDNYFSKIRCHHLLFYIWRYHEIVCLVDLLIL